jgi:hypothetical protein
MFIPSPLEQQRLELGVAAALQVPFIAGVEGYVFESLFHFVKGLPLPNPHATRRSKTLFDCVDATNRIGWSLKSVQKNPSARAFELVIQRADVLKKRTLLELPDLHVNSLPELLGAAVLRHWNMKIEADMARQGVREARIAVLLKSTNHTRYAYLEQSLVRYTPEDLLWTWTDASQTGLQARRVADNSIVFRWYPNQKQLFENFNLPPEAFRFAVHPMREGVEAFLERMLR